MRLVRFQMGMRRTTFRARTEEGEVGADVLKFEAVEPDPQGAERMAREYKAILLEMAGVLTGVAVLFLGSVTGCWARYAGWI